jgi:hypothetical protein
MLDILKKLDNIENKKSLTESTLAECPPEMGMSSQSSGPASLNISAGSASEMAQILKALMSLDQSSTAPVIDMNPEYEGIIGTAAGGALGALAGGPIGAGIGAVAGDALTGEAENKSFANEPDEEYQDHKFMTKDLSGGINRQKKMYKPAAKGDNPMAVESIRDRLYRELNEKKSKDLSEKPNEGNEFSGALAQAKKMGKKEFEVAGKKYKVKEASKPDFLDMDKDGNKKEPMKKAAADKKKEVEEAGMPASVIRHKEAISQMTDKEFAEKYGHKSEKELRDMAARHGYGWNKATKTGSDHYVKRVQKGESAS